MTTSIESRKKMILLNAYREELKRLQRTFDSINVEVTRDLTEMEGLIKKINIIRKKLME